MQLTNYLFICTFALSTIISCTTMNKETTIKNQSDFSTPPMAEKSPQLFINFDKERTDNYFWIKDKNNHKVIEYLNAENQYTNEVMASTEDLQKTIYDEIVGRMKEDA